MNNFIEQYIYPIGQILGLIGAIGLILGIVFGLLHNYPIILGIALAFIGLGLYSIHTKTY